MVSSLRELFRKVVVAVTQRLGVALPRKRKSEETGKGFVLAARLACEKPVVMIDADPNDLFGTLDHLNPYHHELFHEACQFDKPWASVPSVSCER